MKILSISSMDIWPFGMNKGIPSIEASQKWFVRKGHKVCFLCPAKRKGLTLKEEQDGISIRRFRMPFNISALSAYDIYPKNIWSRFKIRMMFNLEWFFFQIYSLFWGGAVARDIKPDLIYAHGLMAAFPSYIISRFFKAKLIVRLYGSRDLYWKWDNLWSRLKGFRDYLSFKVPADYFIITNDGTHADRLAEKMAVPRKKIKCWRNGVDFDFLRTHATDRVKVLEDLRIDPSAKIIVSTSRLLDIYGVSKLVNALPELFKKNRSAVCVIAGEGPEKERIERFISEHAIGSRVFLTGMVERHVIKRLLEVSDIFVLLSKYHNCTNTMWEAMTCGKCIVTSDNDSIREVITPRKDGVLLSGEDMEKLPFILDRLLRDDEQRRLLGENAAKRANETLENWKSRIDREAALLERLVRG